MMIKNTGNQRNQIQLVSADSLVPEDHLLRDIDRAIDFSFIYELVQDKYSQDQGRPSLDPVMLIKIPLLQYLYGIPSMRQTIREIEANVAYRWFLGLDLTSSVPHFSTFGKNYTRRFKGTNLFEQIFEKILEECFLHGMIDPSVIFVDATHIKANANKKKSIKKLVKVQAMDYESKLLQEINEDRQAHGKKPFAWESCALHRITLQKW
jgi:transposase